VRTTAAVLAALAGVVVLAAQLQLLFGPRRALSGQPAVSFLLVHAALAAYWICFGLTAAFFARSSAQWRERMVCPRCGNPGDMRRSPVNDRSMSPALWWLGGAVVATLWKSCRRSRFTCGACQHEAELPTPCSRLVSAWLLCLALNVAAHLMVVGPSGLAWSLASAP
jgi:hypothetical protein